ncbi:MAG: Fe-S cluster assembly ATPase SufC [Anaerolineae bacterium]
MSELVIKDLRVSVDDNLILKGVNLTVKKGEIHALMGPNGSGKSTLAYSLMGHPQYQVEQGEVWFKGENVLEMAPDERARLGLFLAFQYPVTIPGVSVANFLRSALNAQRGASNSGQPISIPEFRKLMMDKLRLLEMDPAFAGRYVNEGFSGGEKKRAEVLQMAVLQPEIAIMDETDSGLDIDALKTVADGVNALIGPDMGVLLITHYQRILQYIKPHKIHIMFNGQIVMEGDSELAEKLEAKGYDWVREKVDADVA